MKKDIIPVLLLTADAIDKPLQKFTLEYTSENVQPSNENLKEDVSSTSYRSTEKSWEKESNKKRVKDLSSIWY